MDIGYMGLTSSLPSAQRDSPLRLSELMGMGYVNDIPTSEQYLRVYNVLTETGRIT